MKKDLTKLLDLSQAEIFEILDLADQLKKEQKAGIPHDFPKGKTLAMIFAKNSTRTRVSFEVGMFQLGGHALFLSNETSQVSRGEPIEDTARVLSRYCDCIMIRTYEQEEVELLAKHATVPVINGLSNQFHPCQVLADLMTIREIKGKLQGLKIAYVGDGFNMANSIIVGGIKCGMDVSIACPSGYEPDHEVIEFAKNADNLHFHMGTDPKEAVKDADIVFTDVWSSMGHEEEHKRRLEKFEGYQVNDELMALAKKDAIVQHCLPAHKGEEISAKVFEDHADEIFEEAENRLHVQKAVMSILMKNNMKK